MATFEGYEDIEAWQKAREHGDHLTKTVADGSSRLCTNGPQKFPGMYYSPTISSLSAQQAYLM
jgi:hypothetical protein